MRSRYSAFVIEDEAYLRRTWHPSTCPKRINVGDGAAWSGLTIHATGGGGLLDRDGIVDFTAARHDGQPVAERSAFTKLDGRWVYVGPA
jgi:SEC-C motif-containing protein